MLKIEWPNFALNRQFWLQSDFFSQVPPPSDFVPVGWGPKILSPPIKNLEKKTLSPVLKLTRIAFSDPKNMPVAYKNFFSIASCHIVNIQYCNDSLIIQYLVNSALRVRFSSENYGILKDCWMKLLD